MELLVREIRPDPCPPAHPRKLTGTLKKKTSKFLFLYLTGFRMQAISILGREVMEPRGLLGLGLDTLDQSGDQMREALALYTSQATLPSVVHCTHGKDRTGKFSAFLA